MDKGQLYPHLQKDFSGLKHLPQFQELFLTLEEVQLLLHQDLGRLKLRPQEASLERLLQKLLLCSGECGNYASIRPTHHRTRSWYFRSLALSSRYSFTLWWSQRYPSIRSSSASATSPAVITTSADSSSDSHAS